MNAHEALQKTLQICGEAREEWDTAPEGMKAGKLLVALCTPTLRYRDDINQIHAVALGHDTELKTRNRLRQLLNEVHAYDHKMNNESWDENDADGNGARPPNGDDYNALYRMVLLALAGIGMTTTIDRHDEPKPAPPAIEREGAAYFASKETAAHRQEIARACTIIRQMRAAVVGHVRPSPEATAAADAFLAQHDPEPKTVTLKLTPWAVEALASAVSSYSMLQRPSLTAVELMALDDLHRQVQEQTDPIF